MKKTAPSLCANGFCSGISCVPAPSRPAMPLRAAKLSRSLTRLHLAIFSCALLSSLLLSQIPFPAFAQPDISPADGFVHRYSYRPSGDIAFVYQCPDPSTLSFEYPQDDGNSMIPAFTRFTPVASICHALSGNNGKKDSVAAAFPTTRTGRIEISVPVETLLGGAVSRSLTWKVVDGGGNEVIRRNLEIRRRTGNAVWHWPEEFESDRLDMVPTVVGLRERGINTVFCRFGHFTIDTDGDGITNDTDPDWDDDGISNELDNDDDGDGIPDEKDGFVDGPAAYRVINFAREYFEALRAAGIETHLSYSFSAEFRARFDKGGESAMAGPASPGQGQGKCSTAFIVDSIGRNMAAVADLVDGVQLDMEGLKDLDPYTSLIRAVRNDSRTSGKFVSICPQIGWKWKFGAFRRLAEECDFMAIMIYDQRWGPKVSSFLKILGELKVTSPEWIGDTVRKFDGYGVPFFAGIPSYDYIKVYDTKGSARDHWSLGSAVREENAAFLESLANDDNFETLDNGSPFKGDHDLCYLFRALADTTVKGPAGPFSLRAGESIKADLVTPAAVRGYGAAAAAGGAKCANYIGFSIFKLGTTSPDEFPEVK